MLKDAVITHFSVPQKATIVLLKHFFTDGNIRF